MLGAQGLKLWCGFADDNLQGGVRQSSVLRQRREIFLSWQDDDADLVELVAIKSKAF